MEKHKYKFWQKVKILNKKSVRTTTFDRKFIYLLHNSLPNFQEKIDKYFQVKNELESELATSIELLNLIEKNEKLNNTDETPEKRLIRLMPYIIEKNDEFKKQYLEMDRIQNDLMLTKEDNKSNLINAFAEILYSGQDLKIQTKKTLQTISEYFV